MVRLDRVAEIALALPQAEEVDRRGQRTWKLGEKTFAWERQFSKADIRRFGEQRVPDDPILAVRVADEAEKVAVLAEARPGFFTIPHFDGFNAVLIELSRARVAHVREALEDAWLTFATPEQAQELVGLRRSGRR